MKLLELNRHPSDRQLRQFGLIALAALPLVGWFWGASGSTIAALAIAGALLAALSMTTPKLVQPLFVGLMLITTPIGMVIGELAMLAIYFGVFLPIGLVFRLTGRDALGLRNDRESQSYWREKRQPKSVANYYRQS